MNKNQKTSSENQHNEKVNLNDDKTKINREDIPNQESIIEKENIETLNNKDNSHQEKKNEEQEKMDPEFLEQMNFFAAKFKEEIDKYEEEIKKLKKENVANLDNQKKYYEQEILNVKKYLFQNFFQDILLVLDSLETGLKAKLDNYEKFMDGLKMTHGIFLNTCKKYHVEPIITKIGDSFDDNIHECMGTDLNSTHNQIASILSHGYKFQDRILRPFKVIVGTKE